MQAINNIFPPVDHPGDGIFAPENVAYFFAKGSLILLGIMYLVFSVITVRQVKIMNTTIETPLGPILQVIAWINLIVSILFLTGIFILL